MVWLVRRLLGIIPLLIAISTMLFAITTFLPLSDRVAPYFPPGSTNHSEWGPCPNSGGAAYPSRCANPDYVAAASALGLGQPIPLQWAHFEYLTFTGQWGYANPVAQVDHWVGVPSGTPVTIVIGGLIPYTLELVALGVALAVLWTIALGWGLTRGAERPAGRLARWAGRGASGIPAFIAAIFLVWIALAAAAGSLGCGSLGWLGGSWPSAACMTGSGLSWVGPAGATHPTGIPTLDAVLHGEYGLAADHVRRLLLPALALSVGLAGTALRRWESRAAERRTDHAVLLGRHAIGLGGWRPDAAYRGRTGASRALRELALSFALIVAGIPLVEFS